MAINIKELFVTDLDPNSGVWWSKDKVDKINYNFNQLSNGGMPGPQGTIGADGGDGNIGAQGYIGYKGPQGYQGYQGSASLNDWDYFPESMGLPGYLFPRKNPISISQAAPVALRIGFKGVQGIDGEFIDPAYGVGVNPTDQTPVQVVKTTDLNSSLINLRVEDNSGFYGYHFNFKSSGNNPRFEISPDLTDPNFKIIYVAQTIVLRTKNPPVSGILPVIDSITITDSQITINNGSISIFNLGDSFGAITTSQDVFRFTTGAAEDKVLVSTDTSGNVEWKNVKDVFGTFPIGSIISIRADEFITDHFWLNDSVNVASGSPLNNIYGRGKAGTDYEGWYLCNGETWETEQGFNQFLTPNLNNFSYTISANGDAQNLITIPEDNPILIGGYDMRILASPDSNGIYEVSYLSLFLDNDSSPGINSINMGNPALGLSYTSQMIHIVYLENHDLKWSNNGVYVPPITTNTIALTLPSNLILCDVPADINYSWTGPNAAAWNTFTIPSTYNLFNDGTTVYAQSGWYVNVDGYPIFWNGTSFTQRGTTCGGEDLNYTPNLKSDAIVDGLNGPLASFSGENFYLDYNAPLFINATTLKWSDDTLGGQNGTGSNAPLGWYRDKATGVRRYWSGSAFVGVSFTEDYVCRVTVDSAGQYDPGYNNAVQQTPSVQNPEPVSICDMFQTDHLTYVAGNTVLTVPSGITLTEHVKNYNSALYVTVNWAPALLNFLTDEVMSTPALINIKDQNKPGDIIKYSKVYMTSYNYPGDSSDFGFLSTSGILPTGKIKTISTCTP